MKEFDDLVEVARLNRKLSPFMQDLDVKGIMDELASEIEELKVEVDDNNPEKIMDELGDVLKDTVLMTLICEEKYGFTITDSINNVIEKMRRRKPQIFEGKELSAEEERRIWIEAKRNEKGE